MTPAPVTVVIPTFNRAADLRRALASLARQTSPVAAVIIVDNSSTDGTEDEIRALMPQWDGRLKYIRKIPEGPASARNTGLAAAATPYVLFHDSDIELPEDWVERALAHMSADPGLAAAGGYILYAFDTSRVNAYGGDLSRIGLAWDVAEGSMRDPAVGPAERIWINCSAMIGRTEAIAGAGGFDEAYFYGYEDSDLGWRLNLMGLRVAVFPDLTARHNVEHDPGVAHPEIVFHYCKNRLRSILKNASLAGLVPMLAAYAAYTLADLALRPPRVPKMRALAWNAARLGETLAARRAIQKRRVLADGVVFRRGSSRWLPAVRLDGRRRRPAEAPVSARARDPAKTTADDRV